MKHEWRKVEKEFYLPKQHPERIIVPKFKYFTLMGEGNPNDEYFAEYIGVLYSLSYAVKMSPKKGIAPDNYFDYTVYPLEGVWDIKENAKNEARNILNKDDFVFNLMIRQPDFVTDNFARMVIERVKKNKPHELLDKVKFDGIEDGNCVQMMHLGSYDDEPQSFEHMEEFAYKSSLIRKSKVHREIYLSDARKVITEKLKTVLRFQVNEQYI